MHLHLLAFNLTHTHCTVPGTMNTILRYKSLFLLIIVTLIPLITPLPKKGYVKYGRLTDSAAVYLENGDGLPKGNFTVNYWMRMDGWYGDFR